MPATARTNRSSAVRFIKWAFGVSLILVLIQILLGGDPLILLLCLLTEAVCVVPIYLYGLGRTVGILYIGIWLAFSFSALLAKTILLQPLDSNLFNPLLSFCIALVGSVAFTTAAVAAYCVKPLQRNQISIEEDPSILSILAGGFFLVGLLSFVISISSLSNSLISNISNQFSVYIEFAFACEIASTVIRTNRRRMLSAFGCVIGLFILYASISGNSKSGVLLVGLAYFLCMAAFKVRVKWPIVITGVLALIFLSEIVFPAIHIVRGYRNRLNPVEVSLLTSKTIGDLLIGDKETLAIKDNLTVLDTASASAGGYQNVYFGSQQIWLDRFTDIGFIDAVARRLDFNGPFLGPESVLDQTMNFLPQQLSPGKTTTFHVASGDKITKALGLSSNEQNTFVTVTFPLELFSAGGFWMILAVGVPVIFLMLVEINFLAFSFSRNVWSISLLLTYGMLFYANTYDMFIFSEVRQIPMNFAVSMGLILFAGLLRSGTRRGAFLRPSLSQFRRSGADG